MTTQPQDENKSSKEIESSILEGDLEQTVRHYWSKYNRAVFVGIAAIFFAYIGSEGISFFKARQIDKLQESYKLALDDGLELEFANKNPKEPISGTIFINQADDAFSQANYPEAINFYQKAQTALKSGPLYNRARMGLAMSTYLKGDTQPGIKELENLMNDKSLNGPTRAQAAYQLALIHVENGNFQQADNFISTVAKLPNPGFWLEKSSLLKRTTNGLANL